MSGNTFGVMFKITTCGESHGDGIGVIIDGCPAGLPITKHEIQIQLNRRKPGQSNITTSRVEDDHIEILSGIFEGITTGTPILLFARNNNQRTTDYNHLKNVFRPSHSDFAYYKKYSHYDYRGGGRSSARETIARVAAGAIAKKYLSLYYGISIISYVQQVGNIKLDLDYKHITENDIESNYIRCPDAYTANKMIELINNVKSNGDSVGGVIKGVIRNLPIGLGEPIFDKLSADLGKAMLSINAVKGFDIGSGFDGSCMLGSENNDAIQNDGDKVKFLTNNSGGINGGISNGDDVHFRVAFKPVSSILKKQNTINHDLDNVDISILGRHDPCVLPRAVPIVDAMSSIVILDHLLRFKSYQ